MMVLPTDQRAQSPAKVESIMVALFSSPANKAPPYVALLSRNIIVMNPAHNIEFVRLCDEVV